MELRWRRWMRPNVLLIAMTAFYGLASVVVGCFVVAEDRAETLVRTEAATQNLVRLLDEHANRTLDAADLVASRLGDRLGVVDAKAVAGEMLVAAPHLANLYLLDRDGRVLVDGRGALPAGTSLADREWFKAVLAQTKPAAVIGAVAFDDPSGRHAFAVARAVRGPSGEMAGIAAALVDVDYFKGFYRNLAVGPQPALGVSRLDGAILIRQPLKVDDLGRDMSGNPIYTSHLRKAPAGTYRGRSADDGVVRVVSYRSVPSRELLVWASVGESEALAQWRMRALRTITLLAAGLAVMAGLTTLLVRDISRQQARAQEMEALNRELKQSNADLEQFAYVASHDLKEPLRNISSYVQLLQRRYEGKLDADADAFIGYTVDGVRRMQAIINALFAYSRVGTGKMVMERVPSGGAVSTALAQLKMVIAEAQAVVEVKGPLPEVMADPSQLASLFQNLIGNGLKYRRPEMRPEVLVGAEDGGREWLFYVRDNGIGIEPQYHSQIFELFRRLHTRDYYAGTGIGLSTCKRIVERHGGRIWLDSQPGEGTTFWFTMPKAASRP